MMDTQAQDLHTNIVSPSGDGHHSVNVCHKCGWPFPNPHPRARHRRAHNKVCGTIEGYKLVDLENTHLTVSDDEHENLSDNGHKTPSPKNEKKVSSGGEMVEISNASEDYVFSDAKTDFSYTVISPGPGNERLSASARESVTNLQKIGEVAFSAHQTLENNANSDTVLPAHESVHANRMQSVEVVDNVTQLETTKLSNLHHSDLILDFSVNDLADAGTKEVAVGLTDGRDGSENDSSPVVPNAPKNASTENMETNADEYAIQSAMPLSEMDKISEGNNLLKKLSLTEDLSCIKLKKPSETEFILGEMGNKGSNSVPECGNVELKEGQSEGLGLSRSQSNSSAVVISVEPVDAFANKYHVREGTTHETHGTDLVREGKENVHMLSVPDNIPLEDQSETLLKDINDHKMLKSDLPVTLHFNEAVANMEGCEKGSISKNCYSSFKSNDPGINSDVTKDGHALLVDDPNKEKSSKPKAVNDIVEKEADSSGSKIMDAENLGANESKAPSDAKGNEVKNIDSTGPLKEQVPSMAAILPVVKEAEAKILDDGKPKAVDDVVEKEADSSGSKIMDAENLGADESKAPSDAKSNEVKNIDSTGSFEEQGPPMAAILPVVKEAEAKILDDSKPKAVNDIVEKEADSSLSKIMDAEDLGADESKAPSDAKSNEVKNNDSTGPLEEQGPPKAAILPGVKQARAKILDDENLGLDFEEALSDASGKVKNSDTAGSLQEQEPPMAINVLVEKEADLYELMIRSPENLGNDAAAPPDGRTGDGEINKSNTFVLFEERGPYNFQNEMSKKIARDSSSTKLDVNPVVLAPATCTSDSVNLNNHEMEGSQMLDIPTIDSTAGAAKDYLILNTNLINERVVDQSNNSSGVDYIVYNDVAEIGHPDTAGYKSTKREEGATMECHAIEMNTIGGTIIQKPQDSGDEIIEAEGNLKETQLLSLEGLRDTSTIGVNTSQSDDARDICSSVHNIQGKDIQEELKDLKICTEDKHAYTGVGSMTSDSAPGTGSEPFQKSSKTPSKKEPRDLHEEESSNQNFMAVEKNQAKEFGGGSAGLSSQSGNEETENRQQVGASPIDVLADSSCQSDSLEGNWGSVSAPATQSDALAIVDAVVLPSTGSQVSAEAERGDLQKPRNALGEHEPDKLDMFEPPSFMTLVELLDRPVQKATSSEIQTSIKQQSSSVSSQAGWFPSLTNVTNESPGREKNEEIIASVTNYSPGKQLATLKSFLDESNNDPKPKSPKSREPAAHVAPNYENSSKVNGASSTMVNPVAGSAQPAKYWNSPARYPTEERKAKSKPYWASFVCCSSVNK